MRHPRYALHHSRVTPGMPYTTHASPQVCLTPLMCHPRYAVHHSRVTPGVPYTTHVSHFSPTSCIGLDKGSGTHACTHGACLPVLPACLPYRYPRTSAFKPSNNHLMTPNPQTLHSTRSLVERFLTLLISNPQTPTLSPMTPEPCSVHRGSAVVMEAAPACPPALTGLGTCQALTGLKC